MSRVSRDEVERALKLEPNPRRRALVWFLWRTGCRLSEALALRAQDIDLELGLVRLVTLKRKLPTSRTMPLDSEFLTELAGLAEIGVGRPFPWTPRVAYGYVRLALERAGVEAGRCHPHALRHGLAVHALRSGVPLNTVSRVLGHASVSTTSLYLRATADDIRADLAKVKW